MNEEQEYWRRLIQELQNIGIGLEKIAEVLSVSERQVSNWKDGQRPTGLTAVRLVEFHGKHRRVLQGSVLHVQVEGTGIVS